VIGLPAPSASWIVSEKQFARKAIQQQADETLVKTAMTGLADLPVHVVAAPPAGLPSDITLTPKPHGGPVRAACPVLDRAVCATTHGGIGRAPEGPCPTRPGLRSPVRRDQFEVARRVELACCGIRLPARKLTVKTASTEVNRQ
jgi:UDP:flavonoid glycosyltransferase YjiC (YdhE family)